MRPRRPPVRQRSMPSSRRPPCFVRETRRGAAPAGNPATEWVLPPSRMVLPPTGQRSVRRRSMVDESWESCPPGTWIESVGRHPRFGPARAPWPQPVFGQYRHRPDGADRCRGQAEEDRESNGTAESIGSPVGPVNWLDKACVALPATRSTSSSSRAHVAWRQRSGNLIDIPTAAAGFHSPRTRVSSRAIPSSMARR